MGAAIVGVESNELPPEKPKMPRWRTQHTDLSSFKVTVCELAPDDMEVDQSVQSLMASVRLHQGTLILSTFDEAGDGTGTWVNFGTYPLACCRIHRIDALTKKDEGKRVRLIAPAKLSSGNALDASQMLADGLTLDHTFSIQLSSDDHPTETREVEGSLRDELKIAEVGRAATSSGGYNDNDGMLTASSGIQAVDLPSLSWLIIEVINSSEKSSGRVKLVRSEAAPDEGATWYSIPTLAKFASGEQPAEVVIEEERTIVWETIRVAHAHQSSDAAHGNRSEKHSWWRQPTTHSHGSLNSETAAALRTIGVDQQHSRRQTKEERTSTRRSARPSSPDYARSQSTPGLSRIMGSFKHGSSSPDSRRTFRDSRASSSPHLSRDSRSSRSSRPSRWTERDSRMTDGDSRLTDKDGNSRASFSPRASRFATWTDTDGHDDGDDADPFDPFDEIEPVLIRQKLTFTLDDGTEPASLVNGSPAKASESSRGSLSRLYTLVSQAIADGKVIDGFCMQPRTLFTADDKDKHIEINNHDLKVDGELTRVHWHNAKHDLGSKSKQASRIDGKIVHVEQLSDGHSVTYGAVLLDSRQEFQNPPDTTAPSWADLQTIKEGFLLRKMHGMWGRRYFVLTNDGQLKWYCGIEQVPTDLVKWERLDGSKPPQGVELCIPALARQLGQNRIEFTSAEMKSFGIEHVCDAYYVKSGTSYFKPAAEIEHMPCNHDIHKALGDHWSYGQVTLRFFAPDVPGIPAHIDREDLALQCEDTDGHGRSDLASVLAGCTRFNLRSGTEVLQLAAQPGIADEWIQALTTHCLLSYQKAPTFSDKRLHINWADQRDNIVADTYSWVPLTEQTRAGTVLKQMLNARKDKNGNRVIDEKSEDDWALFDKRHYQTGYFKMIGRTNPKVPQLLKLPPDEPFLDQLLLRWEQSARSIYGAAPTVPEDAYQIAVRKVSRTRPSATIKTLEMHQAFNDLLSGRLCHVLGKHETLELAALKTLCFLHAKQVKQSRSNTRKATPGSPGWKALQRASKRQEKPRTSRSVVDVVSQLGVQAGGNPKSSSTINCLTLNAGELCEVLPPTMVDNGGGGQDHEQKVLDQLKTVYSYLLEKPPENLINGDYESTETARIMHASMLFMFRAHCLSPAPCHSAFP